MAVAPILPALAAAGPPGWAAAGGTLLLSTLLNFLGRKKSVSSQNAAQSAIYERERADAENRARAGSSIYSDMLKGYGHGALADPELLRLLMLRPPREQMPLPGPSIFSALGGAAGTVGQGMLSGLLQPGANATGEGPEDIISKILALFKNARSPVEGSDVYQLPFNPGWRP